MYLSRRCLAAGVTFYRSFGKTRVPYFRNPGFLHWSNIPDIYIVFVLICGSEICFLQNDLGYVYLSWLWLEIGFQEIE